MEAIDYIRAGMWIIGSVTALTSIAVGVVLYHHWNSYAFAPSQAKVALLTYSGVALFLALVMFGTTPAF